MRKLFISLFLATSILTACSSSDKAPVVIQTPGASTIPVPTQPNNNFDDAGLNGVNGEAGVNGQNGANGQDGIDNHIIKSWSCNSVIEPKDGGPHPSCSGGWIACSINIWYYASETSWGDTTTRVGVDALNEGHQNTNVWPANSEDARNGYNVIMFDVFGTRTFGTGTWEFWLNKNTNTLKIHYTDTELGTREWFYGCNNFNW